ncbi:hypothetical protein P153DRAFT_397280 [Dothidotthia symphoricarpi CBS 119687]|uniref:Uncharacterized protein n=1 Tax=Dothidotthia symphoricarpi CBS 119687 TaxID=1392245 RepID=A0A6A6AF98_9PLEO|nr:uncharacterized protein P153DRAFT_397280 [Dothidotthia symphoricarpi CBS 119687]KAF2129091.1 hypothetical protein P153DRAFT_397280 [Dothidotthia symphoricarpi CBS 119687]
MSRNTRLPPVDARSNSPADASSKLYDLIKGRIESDLNFRGFGNQQSVKDTILSQLQMIHQFSNFNREGVVEAHYMFWAYQNGQLLWRLKVVCDSDNPIVGSEQTPHYGYEIYFDGQKLGGAAGHVWFPANSSPRYWRLPHLRFSEEYRGKHIYQFNFPNNCRMDVAMRFFNMGDTGLSRGEVDARKESEFNWHVVDTYPKPSFGKT